MLQSDGARRFRELMEDQGIEVTDTSAQDPVEQDLPF
jgi:hypothetical protein